MFEHEQILVRCNVTILTFVPLTIKIVIYMEHAYGISTAQYSQQALTERKNDLFGRRLQNVGHWLSSSPIEARAISYSFATTQCGSVLVAG